MRTVGRPSAGAAPAFHSSPTKFKSSTPRNVTVCDVLCAVLTRILSAVSLHVTQAVYGDGGGSAAPAMSSLGRRSLIDMPNITPSPWFDGNLEEAAAFYTSVFPNSSAGPFFRPPEAGSGTPGDVLYGTFVLDGHRFLGINGGPMFRFTEAVSFEVRCADQDEVDYYWS